MIEVVVLKLSTGEEIISRVVSYVAENNTIVLDRPRVMHIVPGRGPDQVGMTLIPFMIGNQEGEVKIYRNHVVAETTPPRELVDGYLQNTSGIALN